MFPDPVSRQTPDVIRILYEFRRGIELREGAMLDDMATRWLMIENRLDADITALAYELQRLKDEGKIITESVVLQSQRYKALREQMEREIAKYNREYAVGMIADQQAAYAKMGIDAAQTAMRSAMGTIGYNFNLINLDAVASMIGFAGNGSPLYTLLQKDYGDAVHGLTNALINGIARGYGPVKTAREMANGFGMGLDRAILIARTETIRSYRTATTEQYRQSGAVTGFRRLVWKPTACMACFVDWKVPILTSKGFKAISKIEVGDLVLTHKGRFKPVTELLRQSVKSAEIITIHVDLPGGKEIDSLTMTIEHPVLTQRGWIRADQLTTNDSITVPTKPCEVCGKPIPLIYRGNSVCSKKCIGILGAKGLHNNPESHQTAKENMIKTSKKMFKNGTHPFQDPEIRKIANRRALQANSKLVSSRTEGKLQEAFEKIGLKPETQYPISSHHNVKQNRDYFYYTDFAFVDAKVVVEADGEPWHSWDEKRIEHDRIRQERIEKQGWSVFRYTGSQIQKNADGIASEIKSILLNHTGQYDSMLVKIKSIKNGTRYAPTERFRVVRYNLEVEEDHSYVAKFATVHNCLMRDGEFFELEEELSDHPAGKCGLISSIRGVKDVQWETGKQWFNKLSPEEQRAKMGAEKYALWKDGQFKLEDLSKLQKSAVWGNSPRVASIKELTGE